MSVRRVGGVLTHAGPRLWHRVDRRRRHQRVLGLLPRVLPAVTDLLGSAEPAGWVVHSSIVSSTLMTVIAVGPPRDRPVAVVKLPATRQGAASQEREARALAALATDTRIGDVEKLLPVRLAAGSVDGQTFTVERALPGVESGPGPAAPDGELHALPLVAAVEVIGNLHRRTARVIVVDATVLRTWVGDRIDIIATAARDLGALSRLRRRLSAAWLGRSVSVGWVHGDFWLGNVLADPHSATVTGIVDWEWAGPDELPAQDVLYMCVHSMMQHRCCEFGAAVTALLDGAAWAPRERDLLAAAGMLADGDRVDADLLLLIWLRQVAYNLIQDPGMAHNVLWVRRNIDAVLRAV